jgi:hypothetical protein
MADWVSVIAATRSWVECTAGERARAGSDGEPLREGVAGDRSGDPRTHPGAAPAARDPHRWIDQIVQHGRYPL